MEFFDQLHAVQNFPNVENKYVSKNRKFSLRHEQSSQA